MILLPTFFFIAKCRFMAIEGVPLQSQEDCVKTAEVILKYLLIQIQVLVRGLITTLA